METQRQINGRRTAFIEHNKSADACVRCGDAASTISLFDLKPVCPACDRREYNHPKYQLAREAFDVWALANGTRPFRGVGLPPDCQTPPGRHVVVFSDPRCYSGTLSTDRVMLAHNYAAAGSSLGCTNAELVERVLRRKKQSGGVSYARHMHGRGVHRPAKCAARERITKLFKPSAWPGPLRILTLPGLRWSFERHLLDMRAGLETEIYSVENDPVIFRASRHFMPGKEQVEVGMSHGDSKYTSVGFRRSELVAGYWFQDAEIFLCEVSPHDLDAVWCDFNGELTQARVNSLRTFWRRGGSKVLAVTWLDARYKAGVAEALKKFCRGRPQRTAADFLLDRLGSGVREIDRHRYSDGFSPMYQLIVGRE